MARENQEPRSRLSVLTQAIFDVELVEKVPATAFRPVPKVDATIVRLVERRLQLRSDNDQKDDDHYQRLPLHEIPFPFAEQVVHHGFLHYTKKIKSNLANYLLEVGSHHHLNNKDGPQPPPTPTPPPTKRRKQQATLQAIQLLQQCDVDPDARPGLLRNEDWYRLIAALHATATATTVRSPPAT